VRTDGKDDFFVAINFSNRPIASRVDLDKSAEFAPVKISGLENSETSSIADLHLKGFGWRIYHRSSTLAAAQ
jgi:hypothetical protein